MDNKLSLSIKLVTNPRSVYKNWTRPHLSTADEHINCPLLNITCDLTNK